MVIKLCCYRADRPFDHLTHTVLYRGEFRDNVLDVFIGSGGHGMTSYRCQCLLKVCDDVLDILGSDGEPDCIRGNPGLFLFFNGELLVGGGCRVDDKALGVPDVGKVAEEFEAVDELSGWPSRRL